MRKYYAIVKKETIGTHITVIIYVLICTTSLGSICRPAFGYLKKLPSLFPSVPLMALTATATCDVVAELKELLGKPVCEIASANKPNSPTQLFRFSPKVPLKDNVHGVCSHVPL